MIIINCVESVLSRNIVELYTSPLKTLVYLLQFLLFILICFKEPVKQKILAFFLVVVTLTVTDMMSLICLSLLGIDQNDNINGITGSMISAVFCLVVSYMLLLGIRIIYNKLKFKEVTNKMWQFQIVILSQVLFIFIVCFSTYSGSDSLDSMIIKSPSWQIWIIIAFVVTVVADVCLYHILITNSQNFDLCRIFTNLLDNAKEACERSENKDKSFIVVTSYIKGSKLFISTENFCAAPPNKKKGKLFSAKQGHKGLGLEIVKEIAQNYSGECVCKYNDNVFTTVVSLELS